MCEYCEKSKNIYTKDKRSVVYIEWDDCKPKLVTVSGGFNSCAIRVPIFFCPFAVKNCVRFKIVLLGVIMDRYRRVNK